MLPNRNAAGASLLIFATPQLSLVVAIPNVTFVEVQATFVVPVVSPGAVIVGGILSVTTTICVSVAVNPASSVTVHVTVVLPNGNGDGASLVTVSTPQLSAEDLLAIENIKQHVDKVVVVLLSGRPLLITDEIPKWDGFVAAWLPGSEGSGITDLLFGNTPFTATLPIAWPASIMQLPIGNDGGTLDGTKLLFEPGFGL